MNNDLKATVIGIVTGLAMVLSHFGLQLSQDWIITIGSVAFIILGYFINKKG